MLRKLKRWAKSLKHDVVALWLAAREPRVPRAAKVLAFAVAAYALSPIDLIPDFVPVVGLLDDLLIVPLGIALAVRLIPPPVMADLRARSIRMGDRPTSRVGIVMVIAIWIAAAILLLWALASRT